MVDAFSMLESERLKFKRLNQDKLRVDMHRGIEENILKGDTDARSIGTRVILPGSFTQGPRYMFNNFVDALQICNWIGFPSLFITITCNPQWSEIQRALSDVYTIEFQKRGLPHAHILIWLHNEDEPKKSKDIDKIICAEIPDKVTDRKIYDLVEKYMIHGPCGLANQNSPCMKDGICTKRFPKSFGSRTEADADGYPVYRRRENGRTGARINVVLCNQNKSIKYLFKYVNKGHDWVTTAFYQSNNPVATPESRYEKKMYYDCRYLSACEAGWRLFSFDIHFRDPPVIRLSFHLLDSQAVVFTDNDSLVYVLKRPSVKQTMFLAWFHANNLYLEARNLRGEDYYLRLLLDFQRGCTCFDDLRKVEDHVYPTFKDACFAFGLLDDDKEYIAGWHKEGKRVGPHVSDDSMRNYTLIEIEYILYSNNKSLSNFPAMPIPIGSMLDATVNRLVLDELDCDVHAMREELKEYLSSITNEQKKVFDDIMDVVTNDIGGLFFLYGHGGTGKTFIWKTLSAAIHSKGEIVINVASSGIASLLLPTGRTVHSRFGLPIIVHESSTCSIKQQSPHAKLLSKANKIISGEAPMMYGYYFEALVKTMKSILNSDKPFGGKVVVLGGDFQQILRVVLKALRQDIVHATINSSPL
ncbi:hypothetical protein ACP275_07G083500 [Erythranthe tilingii]